MNPTGIEAAHAAYAKTVGGLLDGHPMENAIQAYLAATLPADVAGLVERLQDRVGSSFDNEATFDAVEVEGIVQSITFLSARAEAAEAALADIIRAYDANSGEEPSVSVLARAIDTARSLTGVSSNG